MERHTHDSFAQISFNRTVGINTNFYGSELPQDHHITLEVHHSEIERRLTHDQYYENGRILRIRMTSAQFSELITSMNSGSGIPCTLESLEGKNIEALPVLEGRKDFVHRKFEHRMENFALQLKEKQERVKELSNKKTLSKEDQKELNWLVEWITQEVSSNIPYFSKCFQKTMDEVVFEAKTEVENAIQHKITTLGLNALHEENRLLGGNAS